MKIYMIEFHDYDSYDCVGYFTDREKARACCEYLNATRPSEYDCFEWCVTKYSLDETDYDSLNKEIEEQERIEFETRLEREKQEALVEIERLKAKYKL